METNPLIPSHLFKAMGDPDTPSFSVYYLRKDEVLCMEAVNSPREIVQIGRWIGAHAKVDAKILRDATAALDDAVIDKHQLLTLSGEVLAT